MKTIVSNKNEIKSIEKSEHLSKKFFLNKPNE